MLFARVVQNERDALQSISIAT